jgi:hypothetical protein
LPRWVIEGKGRDALVAEGTLGLDAIGYLLANEALAGLVADHGG